MILTGLLIHRPTIRLLRQALPGFFVLQLFFVGAVCAADGNRLLLDDCQKCHALEVRLVAENGGRHADAVSCLDCHPDHTAGQVATLACQSCHTDHPHYALNGCTDCHRDPHRPLATLTETSRPARKECLSCHPDVGTRMAERPGKHAKMFCSSCHVKHKSVPSCLDCHRPHQDNQIGSDCASCHSYHSPLPAVLKGYVRSSFCRTCHKRQADDLARTRTNHGGINCAFCHKGQHPSVPNCQDCHGLPHSRTLHRQYLNCLDCHRDAHNLMSEM